MRQFVVTIRVDEIPAGLPGLEKPVRVAMSAGSVYVSEEAAADGILPTAIDATLSTARHELLSHVGEWHT